MTPLTPAGWILFAAMWIAGPITGYTTSALITAAWERNAINWETTTTAGMFGRLLAVIRLLLMLVPELKLPCRPNRTLRFAAAR